jgi:hypothetical protein
LFHLCFTALYVIRNNGIKLFIENNLRIVNSAHETPPIPIMQISFPGFVVCVGLSLYSYWINCWSIITHLAAGKLSECRSLVDLLVILNLTLPRLTNPKSNQNNGSSSTCINYISGHAQLVTGSGPFWTKTILLLQRHVGGPLSKKGIGMIVISEV